MSVAGPITRFPAEGLSEPQRYIVSFDQNGKSVFLPTDNGDHQSIMVAGAAAQSIMYSIESVPADMNGEADVRFAKKNKVYDIP